MNRQHGVNKMVNLFSTAIGFVLLAVYLLVIPVSLAIGVLGLAMHLFS